MKRVKKEIRKPGSFQSRSKLEAKNDPANFKNGVSNSTSYKLALINLIPAVISAIALIASLWINWHLIGRSQQQLENRKQEQDEKFTQLRLQLDQAKKQSQDESNLTQKTLGQQSTLIEQAKLAIQERSTKSSIEYDRRKADVEEKRQKIETIRLAGEIIRAQASLAPSVSVECDVLKRATPFGMEPLRSVDGTLSVGCRSTNAGHHKVNIQITGVLIYSGTNPTPIQDGLVANYFVGSARNSMPVGGKSSNEFTVKISQPAKSLPSKTMKVNFLFETDPRAVKSLKSLAEGIVDSKDIDEIAVLRFSNDFDIE